MVWQTSGRRGSPSSRPCSASIVYAEDKKWWSGSSPPSSSSFSLSLSNFKGRSEPTEPCLFVPSWVLLMKNKTSWKRKKKKRGYLLVVLLCSCSGLLSLSFHPFSIYPRKFWKGAAAAEWLMTPQTKAIWMDIIWFFFSSFSYKHAIDGLVRVAREEGFRKLFSGADWASSRAVLVTVGQLCFYDVIKAKLLENNFQDNLTTHFTSSLCAVRYSHCTLIKGHLHWLHSFLRVPLPRPWPSLWTCSRPGPWTPSPASSRVHLTCLPSQPSKVPWPFTKATCRPLFDSVPIPSWLSSFSNSCARTLALCNNSDRDPRPCWELCVVVIVVFKVVLDCYDHCYEARWRGGQYFWINNCQDSVVKWYTVFVY